MDVTVQVVERATRYLKGGVGYGTETKERVSLGYEDRNLFGNETLNLVASVRALVEEGRHAAP